MLTHIRNAALGALAVLALAAPAPSQSCAGDLNNDGIINGEDLGQLLAAWGPCQSCEADLSANGVVDGADLGVQLGNWGECVTIPTWATVVEAQPDPAVVTDPTLRAAIIATGRPWRVRDTGTGIEMLLVPPGTFQMGCVSGSVLSPCVSGELPVHQVTLTLPFYLGRFEVTQAQWIKRIGSNPARFQAVNGYPGPLDRPVESVSWSMAKAFADSAGLRLPTEAEWEFACRAGTDTPFHSGPGFPAGTSEDSLLGWIAHYRAAPCQVCLINTASVGSRAANSLGMHDMLGNVWEWTNDRIAPYSGEPQTDPGGPSAGTARAYRGGSFAEASGACKASFRRGLYEGGWYNDLGFRVARTP